MNLDITLSVDKIALFFKSKEKGGTIDITPLHFEMQKYGYEAVKEWESSKPATFSYNADYLPKGEKEGAVYIGFGLNKPVGEDEGTVKVEFNPNKVSCPLTAIFQFLKYYDFKLSYIGNVDFAVDIPINLSRFHLLPKCGASVTQYYGPLDNLTMYLNPTSEEKRLKVYDKAKERGLDGNLTRCEVTVKRYGFHPAPYEVLSEMYEQVSCFSHKPESGDPLMQALLRLHDIDRSAIFGEMRNKHTRSKYKKGLRELAILVDEMLPPDLLKSFTERVSAFYSVTECLKEVKPLTENFSWSVPDDGILLLSD